LIDNPFSLKEMAFDYKIINKEGQLIPLVFTIYQKAMHEIVEKIESDKRPVRIIVLKPRQCHISTYCEAYIYNKTTTNFFTKSMVIADDEKNTSNLFNMSKNFYDYSAPEFRPMRKASNEKALIFGNPDSRGEDRGLNSSIHVETAGKGTAGRGGTIRNLHCSEFAFWPRAGEVVSGLFNSVPAKPGTAIFIESTANGMAGKGQEFYERWQKATRREKQDGAGFFPVFFPWFWNPEYEMEPDDNFSLKKDEIELQKLYPEITERKLAFRRYKIENEMGSATLDPKDQWDQEYPHSPECAFIMAGRPVFQAQIVLEHIKSLEGKEYKRGTLDSSGRFYERDDGPYKIYQTPKPGGIYAIGADVAEGLASGDYSTMAVIDRGLDFFASYFDHIAPDLFGKELLKCGRYYEGALLAPEINNHGHTVIATIKADYSNIYTRQVQEERGDEYTEKLGWQTNVKSKMKMLDDFVGAYRDNQLKIYDIDLLKEMLTLFVEEDGDIKLNGKDRVVAAMIALQAVKQVPFDVYEAEVPKARPKRFTNLQEKMEWLKNNTEKESYESAFDGSESESVF